MLVYHDIERLDDFDLSFLNSVFDDAEQIKPLFDRHPELEGIAGKMVSLFHTITAKGLANEDRAASS
jgi:hypothetical protein